MKNVDLTGIFLTLMGMCNVAGFTITSIKKDTSNEPADALIRFYPMAKDPIDIEAVTEAIKPHIKGDVVKLNVEMHNGTIKVYIEFDTNIWNDDYAYNIDTPESPETKS